MNKLNSHADNQSICNYNNDGSSASDTGQMGEHVKNALPLWRDKGAVRMGKLPCLWWLALAAMVLVYGSYGVLMNLSKVDGQIPFSSMSMVLLIEAIKFLFSIVLYVSEVGKNDFSWPSIRLALPFSVPAILYSINNNLSVILQSYMDPASYQVLSNLKIVTTAVLYKLILKRSLSIQQWISVGLLTLAGICDSYGSIGQKSESPRELRLHVTVEGLVIMFIYCTISALAGVYTEYILKKDFLTSLHLQNILLYVFCIFINLGSWFMSQFYYSDSEGTFNFFKGFSFYTWLIIFTQAFNGLAMSVVMKHGNNLVRLFVISCAMIVSTALSVIVLGISLNVLFFIALFLVVFAIYLYYQ